MKRKIIVFILTTAMLLSSIPCVVSAASGGDVATPYWLNTAAVSCKIGFPDDGYGYAEAHVTGHLTVSKISGHVYVYRQVGDSWIYVSEAHKTVESCSLTISCKFTPIEDAYYRANYTFVVTKDGVDETITHTVYKTYP